MSDRPMELQILSPDRLILRTRVQALRAADASGRFGLWKGHEPMLSVLVPSVLSYRTEDGVEWFAAVDGGVLILEDQRISIATRDAAVSARLDDVADAAAAMIASRRTKEQEARAAFAELEASLLRELRKAEPRP